MSKKKKKYGELAETVPDIKAIRKFRTPAYQSEKLIRAQAEQLKEK